MELMCIWWNPQPAGLIFKATCFYWLKAEMGAPDTTTSDAAALWQKVKNRHVKKDLRIYLMTVLSFTITLNASVRILYSSQGKLGLYTQIK